MRTAVALGLTALAGLAGMLVLGPPSLPGPSVAKAIAVPHDAQLQLTAARDAAAQETAAGNALAARLARSSLTAMPYNQGALALITELGGTAEGTQAINLAAALGWRDALTNVRLVQLAVVEQSAPIAAQRADALGRSRGGDFAATIADLVMTMPGGPNAMGERASHRSGSRWWITYLRIPATSAAAERGRLDFLRAIDSNDGTWLRWITTAAISSLQGNSAADDGFSVWRDTLAEPSSFGTILYDEQFTLIRSDIAPLGGEWRLRPRAPYAAERAPEGLELSRLRPGEGVVLAQVFRAEAGAYRLVVDGETGPGGWSWTIACTGQRTVLESEGLIGEWPVSLGESCQRPILQLVAAEAQEGDGRALLKRVALEPAQ